MSFSKTTAIAALMTAAAALPAAAQDLCGGAAANGTWIGGSDETSDIASGFGPFDMTAQVPAGGEHVAIFNVSTASDVRVEAAPVADGDTVIDLLDASGVVILSDDDGGGFLASRGEISLDPGTYCLATRSYDDAALTADVRVGLTVHDPITSGGFNDYDAVCLPETEAVSFGGANLNEGLEAGVAATASIGDTPFYRFNLSEPTSISFTAENQSADPILRIFDNTGYMLAENDDYDGLNSRLDFVQPLEAGTYCIGLIALSDPGAPVTVTANAFSEQDYLETLYNNAETSPPLDGSYPVTDLGLISTRARADVRVDDDLIWHQFQVDQPGLILIEGIGTGGVDAMLTLFDDFGRMITQNDDYGQSLDAQIAARVQPGTYVLAVGRPADYFYGEPGITRVGIEMFVSAR